jgi:hypothetical protein
MTTAVRITYTYTSNAQVSLVNIIGNDYVYVNK